MKTRRDKIAPDCAYCAKGGKGSACREKAEKLGKTFCARFVYDPLRRQPKPLLVPEKHSDDEFKL